MSGSIVAFDLEEFAKTHEHTIAALEAVSTLAVLW